jgi:hypothetical protein
LLALLSLEKHNPARAEQLIQRIESLQPGYPPLAELRSRLQAERNK